MRAIQIFFCTICCVSASAQFAVGYVSITYTDATRNRELPFELLYPAQSSGQGVACSDGTFPYIVMAHGFSMQSTDYTYLAEALVSHGYMVLQLATESGFAPSHADYGLDILFLAAHFRDENITAGSLFAGHVLPKVGVIGHSMGGGSAWLAAAQSNGNIDCLVGMAPAETNPSAIDAAMQVVVPAMILSGSSDAVTPPAQNHQPIYEETSSACKVFISVLEGSHCGFADAGTLCQFGEFGFNGLSTNVQQSITLDMVKAWMDLHLNDVAEAAIVIENYDESQSNTQTQNGCVISSLQDNPSSLLRIFPNPSSDKIYLVDRTFEHLWQVYNSKGQRMALTGNRTSDGRVELDVSSLESGIYVIVDSDNATNGRFMVR